MALMYDATVQRNPAAEAIADVNGCRPANESALVPLKPEWVRIPDATSIFGIGRSRLYVLIEEGKIRSSVIRDRGKIRGIRLLNYDSLAAFVEGSVVEPKGSETPGQPTGAAAA